MYKVLRAICYFQIDCQNEINFLFCTRVTLAPHHDIKQNFYDTAVDLFEYPEVYDTVPDFFTKSNHFLSPEAKCDFCQIQQPLVKLVKLTSDFLRSTLNNYNKFMQKRGRLKIRKMLKMVDEAHRGTEMANQAGQGMKKGGFIKKQRRHNVMVWAENNQSYFVCVKCYVDLTTEDQKEAKSLFTPPQPLPSDLADELSFEYEERPVVRNRYFPAELMPKIRKYGLKPFEGEMKSETKNHKKPTLSFYSTSSKLRFRTRSRKSNKLSISMNEFYKENAKKGKKVINSNSRPRLSRSSKIKMPLVKKKAEVIFSSIYSQQRPKSLEFRKKGKKAQKNKVGKNSLQKLKGRTGLGRRVIYPGFRLPNPTPVYLQPLKSTQNKSNQKNKNF